MVAGAVEQAVWGTLCAALLVRIKMIHRPERQYQQGGTCPHRILGTNRDEAGRPRVVDVLGSAQSRCDSVDITSRRLLASSKWLRLVCAMYQGHRIEIVYFI